VEAFHVIMRILTAAISLYTLLIMFRILLTWFGRHDFGRPMEILAAITDPYLNWFRRLRFMQFGGMDFSPILALITLSVLSTITGRLAVAASITFGFILALIVARLASAAGFFVGLFLVLSVIRLIGSMMGVNTAGRFWIIVDRILEPAVHKVALTFTRGKFITYRNALLLFAVLLVIVLLLGRYLVATLVTLLAGLPF